MEEDIDDSSFAQGRIMKENYNAWKKALVVQISMKDIELPPCNISIPLTVVKEAPSNTIENLHCLLRNLQKLLSQEAYYGIDVTGWYGA